MLTKMQGPAFLLKKQITNRTAWTEELIVEEESIVIDASGKIKVVEEESVQEILKYEAQILESMEVLWLTKNAEHDQLNKINRRGWKVGRTTCWEQSFF